MYKDLEKVKQRHADFWACENHERPLLIVVAPNGKVVPPPAFNGSVRDEWLDAEYVIKNARRRMETTYYAGDSFPMYWPNLGPDIIGAVAGCELVFGRDTSWAVHFVEDWAALPEIVFDENNFYYKKLLELTQAALCDSKGEYILGTTDIHAGMDGLVAMRGPDRLCMDVIEYREELLKRADQLFEVEKKVFEGINSLLTPAQTVTTNWMGIIHPNESYYPTSCDFSCMISGNDFEELVIPGIIKELEYFGSSIYHLDGTGALRHLDRLLEIDTLKGIQWVPGAGKPSASHWIPELKKIQAAGKLIDICAEPWEIKALCQSLKPEGLCIHCYAENAEQADEIVNIATRERKK